MEKKIMYKYNQMELEQFALFEEGCAQEINEVQCQTEVQFGYDKKQLVFCCKMTHKMTFEGKPILKSVLNSYFDINQESVDQLTENNIIHFPVNFLVQIASLSYGTLRGVIFTKTLGTMVNKLILPPIYLNEMIDKEYAVSL